MPRVPQKKKKIADKTSPGQWIIIGAIALVVILIAVVVVRSFTAGTTAVEPRARYMANGMFMGNPNAPVKVINYSDFLCVHCYQYFLEQGEALEENYINKDLVYMEFVPFNIFGERSAAAISASYCAAEQNKFWEYHDILFVNQPNAQKGAFSNTNLVKYAGAAGLDTAQFRQCFDSGKYDAKVIESLERGKADGIEGTPSFLINGRFSYRNTLEAIIDEELAKNK